MIRAASSTPPLANTGPYDEADLTAFDDLLGEMLDGLGRGRKRGERGDNDDDDGPTAGQAPAERTNEDGDERKCP